MILQNKPASTPQICTIFIQIPYHLFESYVHNVAADKLVNTPTKMVASSVERCWWTYISREEAEVAAKVLTLSYKTYCVIFILIYFLVVIFQ